MEKPSDAPCAGFLSISPLDDRKPNATACKPWAMSWPCAVLFWLPTRGQRHRCGRYSFCNNCLNTCCNNTGEITEMVRLQPGNSGFHRFKVRVKPEIVSFGVDDLDMSQSGEHVDAQTWNRLLDDPEVIVIDTRNDYEIDIGSFDGAVSRIPRAFGSSRLGCRQLDPDKHTKVAMFCTGGIRCEKASAYMLNKGFENVYQLDGGILQYLEDTQASESRWNGEALFSISVFR